MGMGERTRGASERANIVVEYEVLESKCQYEVQHFIQGICAN